MSSKEKKKPKLKRSQSARLGKISKEPLGSSPFPGIRLQNVVDPESLNSQEDVKALSYRSAFHNQDKAKSSASLGTFSFKSLNSPRRGGPSTPRGSSNKDASRQSRKDKRDKREKKEKKEKKDKGMAPSPLGAPLGKAEKSEEEKREEQELKDRYKALPQHDKNAKGNPNKFALLHPRTQKAIIDAGINGEEAEKDPLHWMALTNSMRFLKIDKGLHFSNKPTKPPRISEQEGYSLLSGPAPHKLKMNEEIGEGAYGKVFKCKCPSITKGFVALKKMPNKTDKENQQNLNEIRMLSKYGHPNIVKFHCCYTANNEYWMVSELMEGGTLEEAMCEYAEKHIAFAARDILRALNHLHQHGIVHRDLKSPNIMLDIQGVVKLIDFGLATISGETELIQMCGSPYWLSPEMIRMEPHSCPTDIWSFAISLIEMKNGIPPNKHKPLTLMYKVGCLRKEDPPVIPADTKGWSAELADFVSICLAPDPDKRATAKELLEHAFLKKCCKKSEMSEVLTRIFVKESLVEMGIGL
mmetsp:Transcript_13941/g.21696  ORF Transcript_13941/g.21696 Transcript_13941/m.21696 type:complete len:525 (-) Transcript_13941:140-1714(-)